MNNKILNINQNINRNLGNRPVQSIPIHWAKKNPLYIRGLAEHVWSIPNSHSYGNSTSKE